MAKDKEENGAVETTDADTAQVETAQAETAETATEEATSTPEAAISEASASEASTDEAATDEAATSETATSEAVSDDEEIDYDAVGDVEIETGDEEEEVEADDTEEDEEDEAVAEPEYTTGTPPGDVERNSGLGAAAGQPELADALGSLPAIDETERKEVVGGRAYELIYILRASAADAADEINTNVQNIVEAGEGAIDHTRKSELRRLAYPINKENEGHYIVINGRFRAEIIPELERMLKLEERLLRYMIIREDD